MVQANENVERGALKEIKYNKKSDNCVGGPGGEHVFHSVSSGEAPQVWCYLRSGEGRMCDRNVRSDQQFLRAGD